MKTESIVLLTKDILMAKYLPTYGNAYWQTPNIDDLAQKGTVFLRHYTAAPSTGMAFTAMATGKYPYEMKKRRRYLHVQKSMSPDFLFEQMEQAGYDCHIIWNDNYLTFALPYSNCFSNATIHVDKLNQYVGPHKIDSSEVIRDDVVAGETMVKLQEMINKILDKNQKVFLWIHLPHVWNGRTSYGGDIDLLDQLVGFLRIKISDDNIFLSADHGNMNGNRQVFGYGFHVYEPAIRIPLITPKVDGLAVVDWPTSNIQLKDIILSRHVEHKEYVLSDTAYIAQPKRRLAIVHNNYKLIYNKVERTFELYDVVYDDNENVNLLNVGFIDKERNRINMTEQVYFYPYWEQAHREATILFNIFFQVWKEGTWRENLRNDLKKVQDYFKFFSQKRKIKHELHQMNEIKNQP